MQDVSPATVVRNQRRSDMSDQLTPDNVLIEEGGETYEDLANLSSDTDE
jgi:predicted double-glycine peptidase